LDRRRQQWYRLREIRSTVGNRFVVVGDFGDFKRGLQCQVEVDWKGMASEERARLTDQRREQAEHDQKLRQAAAARAAMTAAALWSNASRCGASEYLTRKGVEPEACRYLQDGSIVIPLLRYDEPRAQALKATQRIWGDGTKRFSKGFQKAGVCLRLGLVVTDEPLLVCEGYATGLTLRMAVHRRLPVFVALDAGNLLPVVELLRTLHPESRILICADDDHNTVGNPGREHARRACQAVKDCRYTWPVFRPGRRGPKDTDMNDLHRLEGLPVVRRQLLHVLPLLGCKVLRAA
jgi:putative DNA primase/helicase